MEALVIKDWLDILPTWLEFALRFPVSPETAFGPYVAPGTISKPLTWLAVAGIAVSYVLIAVTAPPSLARDRSPLVRFFRRIDLKLLPPLLIIAAVAFSIGLHLVTRLFLPILDAPAGKVGTVEDTVNATLGFASVYIPFGTLIYLIGVKLLSISGKRKRKGPLVLTVVILFANAIVFVVYLSLSLAAVHRINPVSAWAAVNTALFAAWGIFSYVAKWSKKS